MVNQISPNPFRHAATKANQATLIARAVWQALQAIATHSYAHTRGAKPLIHLD